MSEIKCPLCTHKFDLSYIDELETEIKKLTEGKISELLIDDRYGVYEIEYVERLLGLLKKAKNYLPQPVCVDLANKIEKELEK